MRRGSPGPAGRRQLQRYVVCKAVECRRATRFVRHSRHDTSLSAASRGLTIHPGWTGAAGATRASSLLGSSDPPDQHHFARTSSTEPSISRMGASREAILAHRGVGAPGGTRTPDTQVRSLVLYPTELRARCALPKGTGQVYTRPRGSDTGPVAGSPPPSRSRDWSSLLYKLTGRGDACVAPMGWLTRSTPSTACLWAGLIVCVKVNRRILVGAEISSTFSGRSS